MRIALCLAVGICLLAGCKKEGSGGSANPVVARAGLATVSRASVEDVLAKLPPSARAQYRSADALKKLVDPLIDQALLVDEAHKRGIQAADDHAAAQKLLEQEATAGAPSDEELRRYYDAHPDEFHRPEKIRIAMILLATPKGAPDWKQKHAEAEALAGTLSDDASFFAAAQKRSDDPVSAPHGGDLGFLTTQELLREWDAAIVEGAREPQNMGHVEVVDRKDGVAIVKYLGAMPAVDQSLEQAMPELRQRLGATSNLNARDALLKRLRAKAEITYDDAMLEELARGSDAGR